ncbi:hypothetical protein JB92DRAFT_3203919, partial [Gautieria morchelliformis]
MGQAPREPCAGHKSPSRCRWWSNAEHNVCIEMGPMEETHDAKEDFRSDAESGRQPHDQIKRLLGQRGHSGQWHKKPELRDIQIRAFEVILGKPWLQGVKAMHHYEVDELTIEEGGKMITIAN